jgi:MOSC domain-containing protein YiiM
VADEVRQEMNATLGLSMQPGDFNEQDLVSGLGDLADVEMGSHVVFGTGVELEVVDRAYPCTKLEAHNGAGLIQALAEKRDGEIYTRRGILARVLQSGDLQPGVSVTIQRPTPPEV